MRLVIEQNFKLKIVIILDNGEKEKGNDEGGMLSDCLTEFWNIFYDTYSTGCDMKVLYFCHDFTAKEWTAVARVIFLGWKQADYLPLLCQPFPQNCLIGSKAITTSLIDDFMSCVTYGDILTAAINNINLVNQTDLISVIQLHDTKKIPTATSNI